ncbi:hypothetical protein, partial [Pseudomonas gessardii]
TILNLLIDSCPLQVEITVETLNLPKGDYEKSPPSSGLILGFYNQTPEEEVLNSTLEWLIAEGYIRAGARDHYVATLQTLKLYGSVPSALSS